MHSILNPKVKHTVAVSKIRDRYVHLTATLVEQQCYSPNTTDWIVVFVVLGQLL